MKRKEKNYVFHDQSSRRRKIFELVQWIGVKKMSNKSCEKAIKMECKWPKEAS